MSTGGWVLVWVLLVVAALAFYTLIALRLYRKAVEVFREATATTEVLATFADALDAAEHAPYDSLPSLLASAEQRAAWSHERRINRIRRKKRKAVRRALTLERWKAAPMTFPRP